MFTQIRMRSFSNLITFVFCRDDKLVVGVVAVRIEPPVVGDDAGRADGEVIVGQVVFDFSVLTRVRVRGLHLQDRGSDGNVFVNIVSLVI